MKQTITVGNFPGQQVDVEVGNETTTIAALFDKAGIKPRSSQVRVDGVVQDINAPINPQSIGRAIATEQIKGN